MVRDFPELIIYRKKPSWSCCVHHDTALDYEVTYLGRFQSSFIAHEMLDSVYPRTFRANITCSGPMLWVRKGIPHRFIISQCPRVELIVRDVSELIIYWKKPSWSCCVHHGAALDYEVPYSGRFQGSFIADEMQDSIHPKNFSCQYYLSEPRSVKQGYFLAFHH